MPTDDLVALVAVKPPVVIDALLYFAGRSIASAVGLRDVGKSGDPS